MCVRWILKCRWNKKILKTEKKVPHDSNFFPSKGNDRPWTCRLFSNCYSILIFYCFALKKQAKLNLSECNVHKLMEVIIKRKYSWVTWKVFTVFENVFDCDFIFLCVKRSWSNITEEFTPAITRVSISTFRSLYKQTAKCIKYLLILSWRALVMS